MKQIYIEDIMQLPWDKDIKVLFEIKKEEYYDWDNGHKLSRHTDVVKRSQSKIGIYKGIGVYGLLEFVFLDLNEESIYGEGALIHLDNPGSYNFDCNDFAWIDGYTDHNEHYNFFLVEE